MSALGMLLIGFALDLCFGDPLWFPHIVVGMGRLISLLEKGLRRLLPRTPRGELWGGALLAALVPAVSAGLTWLLLFLGGLVHPLFRLAIGSFFCWQCLAMRSLGQAGSAVYRELKRGDLPAAREAVGRIVGRDAAALDEAGVARAAVETVAENTSDGVIAPMLYLALAGPVGGVLYKAINTMDSMVGYKNEAYLYFGRAAARLDDAANLLPSRLAALFMVAAAYLGGFDGKGAWRIFRRDRLNHKSPNSAQTESACAGALGIRLGGGANYFGQWVEKPTIGDALRPIESEDIRRANRLLHIATALFLAVCTLARGGVILWLN